MLDLFKAVTVSTELFQNKRFPAPHEKLFLHQTIANVACHSNEIRLEIYIATD